MCDQLLRSGPMMFSAPNPADPTTVKFPLDKSLRGEDGEHLVSFRSYALHDFCLSVINSISSRPVVTNLSLAHHKLGDEGVVKLLKWLVLPAGRRYRYQITEIDLGSNHLGDEGLSAFSAYLRNNTKLRSVILQRVRLLRRLHKSAR